MEIKQNFFYIELKVSTFNKNKMWKLELIESTLIWLDISETMEED